MKNTIALLLLAVCCGSLWANDEPMVKAPIVKAALFKNGFALVVREIKTTPEKPFLIDEELDPVHGTLWFSPGEKLAITGIKRIREVPNDNPLINLAASYENQHVTVTLKADGNEPPRVIKGTLIRPGKHGKPLVPEDIRVYYNPKAISSFIVIKDESGRLFTFPEDSVKLIESGVMNSKLAQEKQMMLVDRKGASSPLYINYMTYGVTWAPAYRIALGRDNVLQVDQTGIIINELEDLKNVEINLVSGFPNLEYQKVVSPLGSVMDLNRFFQQLHKTENPYARKEAMTQMYYGASSSSDRSSRIVSPLPETMASEDIHFTPAGRITLAKDQTLYQSLDSAKTSYERLVEWVIPDMRNIFGQYREYNRYEQQAPVNPNGNLWDSVRFKNPFQAPITTAPAEIVDGEKVLGQGTIEWTNIGEETLVHTTKAETMSGIRMENEVAGEKKETRFGSWRYRNPDITGTLKLNNFRKNEAKVLIRMQYSGEFISAEREPQQKLLDGGSYGVNARRELTWELSLKPGEEVTINYKYSVLIRD